MTDFDRESNIFGVVNDPLGPFPEPASTATTIAGKLIDHLKYIADANILLASNKADWLSIASITGQNVGDQSIMRKSLTEPDPIKSADLVNGWTLPSLPAIPALPAIPEDLNVNIDKIESKLTSDIAALQSSWMGQFIPNIGSLSVLDTLTQHILDGSAAGSADSKLSALGATLTSALNAIQTSTLSAVSALISAMGVSISANVTTQKGNIAAALALAEDNTQEIAWTRMRDQAAREGKRLEDEALTEWASRGFSLPGGVLLNQVAHQRQATLNAASDAAAQEAKSIQQAFIEIAKVTVDSWQRTMELENRAQIEQFKAVSDANLRFATLQLEGNRANAELAVKQLGLTLDFTKGSADVATRYRVGLIEGMDNLVRAYAQLRSNEAESVRAIAGAKAQMMTALVEFYRAAVQSVDVGLHVEMANKDNAIRYIGAAGQIIGAAVGHHVQAAGASADAFAKIAGMALSGLNAVATQTANG